MSDRQFEQALIIGFIVIVVISFAAIFWAAAQNPSPPADSPTITEPALIFPGIRIYEFNTPGQMHCVLAVDRASKFARTPALSCIAIPSLKVDPRRWEKKGLPTPDVETGAGV